VAHATEILGDVGYDFVVIDEEHAPFDRLAIDQALLSTRAALFGPAMNWRSDNE